MRVSVRLFAGLRERAGENQIELELPDTASVGDALAQLEWLTGGIRVVMAVNREYADASTRLSSGDELALIPPVSGGGESSTGGGPASPPPVRITSEPLSLEAVAARVADPRAGAVVAFLGVTREVPALEYEAYAEMAEAKLAAIVAASAPHRDAAFAGARYLIDEIKAQAPIWKREEGEWLGEAVPGEAVDTASG